MWICMCSTHSLIWLQTGSKPVHWRTDWIHSAQGLNKLLGLAYDRVFSSFLCFFLGGEGGWWCRRCCPVDWTGWSWIGLARVGSDWNGMEWIGLSDRKSERDSGWNDEWWMVCGPCGPCGWNLCRCNAKEHVKVQLSSIRTRYVISGLSVRSAAMWKRREKQKHKQKQKHVLSLIAR